LGNTDHYNVVWDTASKDYNGSMPLGNGDIGLNLWVEDERGDLCFYISKTDTWGDNSRLLKVGKVRFTFEPGFDIPMPDFKQTLKLREGMIEFEFARGQSPTVLRVWVDAEHPTIHVEADGAPMSVTASIELWRKERSILQKLEPLDAMAESPFTPDNHPPPDPITVEPDTVLEGLSGQVSWLHHNIKSVGPEIHAKIQGVADFEREDPLLHRTFGAMITAVNGQRLDSLNLRSPSAASHRFSINVLTEHPSAPEQWQSSIEEIVDETESIPINERREAHKRWWHEFWERSWIDVTSPDSPEEFEEHSDAFEVSRSYALQRFINACAGRGRYPMKYNGSNFTVPYPDKEGDADYRYCGADFCWQNQRMPYISMCTSGDFDLMQPLFQMYGKELLPLNKFRTRKYFDHDGAYYPEIINFWGDVINQTYGWTPYEEREDPLQASGWHKWEWVCGLELVTMMLDYFEHTEDEIFLRDMLLPTAREVLIFFDQHYKTDECGKLHMHPAQALETWWDATNPMDIVAGLHWVVDRLSLLKESLTTADQRDYWIALKQRLPDLPTREVDGIEMLAPAARFAEKRNIENPELYAVFPFRLFGVGRPNIELAIEALEHRWDKGNWGWRQDDIFMAFLGLADQAREYLVGRARRKHSGSRFPAFWGPNYDGVPDQCHGGVLLKTLQSMLMQTDGMRIILLPAWPKDWDVDFKLHAPYKTTVEGTVEGGELVRMVVTPKSRSKDVEVIA
jgi:alpha-L-fucosidase 2